MYGMSVLVVCACAVGCQQLITEQLCNSSVNKLNIYISITALKADKQKLMLAPNSKINFPAKGASQLKLKRII